MIEGRLRTPVVDATGLTGKYDFDVWWGFDDLEPDTGSPSGSPTFRSAIQSLGLRIDSRKAPVEVVVVEEFQESANRELTNGTNGNSPGLPGSDSSPMPLSIASKKTDSGAPPHLFPIRSLQPPNNPTLPAGQSDKEEPEIQSPA